MTWNDLKLRLRSLMFPKRGERELEDELDFHVEMQTRKNIAAGMGDSEAIERARLQFGRSSQVREDCREARRIGLLETAWQDIRYALRGFRRSPSFVLTVVATVALGLGLNTALFTIFNGTYFRPIGVREAKQLYEAYWMDRGGESHDFTWAEYQEFLKENAAFSEILGYKQTEARMDGHTMLGTLVTGEYFRVLGVGASIGRTLLPEDAQTPGREPVAVLSHRAWQGEFLSDPHIVGRKIFLRGHPYEVVGVAAAGFGGLGSRPSEFWIPVTMDEGFGGASNLSVVGRLKDDVDMRKAQAGLTLWAQRLTSGRPDKERAMRGMLLSRATTKPLNLKSILVFAPILVAFSLVLLMGSANVANMMLARAMSRQREIGIRLSLGASRGRLIRQLLTESILLSVPSAIAGLVVSEATIALCLRVLIATLPPGVASFAARIPSLASDLRVFAFAFVAALVSAFVFGLAPALQATRTNIMQTAKGEFGNDFRPWKLRNSLVIGQVTVCVLLLITAGILLRGANQIHSLDASLSARNTIEIEVQEAARERVVNRIYSEPFLDTLGAASSAPVDRKPMVPLMAAEGGAVLNTAANNVSPEYFGLFEIPILRGRNFTSGESRGGAAVAVISQTLADVLWPKGDAIGKSLRFVPDSKTDPSLRRYAAVRVIGVARDEISRWVGSGEDKGIIYLPNHAHAAGAKLFASAHGDIESARRKLEADLSAIDPNAMEDIKKLQIREWVEEDAYYTFRIAYWLSSAIGLMALVLTLSGIYGVLSYVVSQRTKEIGIRMAIGATTGAVTRLVLRQSMRLAVIGASVGAVLALAVSKVLASGLVMINTFDAAAYVGGAGVVLVACAAAAYFPSRRAARIDPLTTLRYD